MTTKRIRQSIQELTSRYKPDFDKSAFMKDILCDAWVLR